MKKFLIAVGIISVIGVVLYVIIKRMTKDTYDIMIWKDGRPEWIRVKKNKNGQFVTKEGTIVFLPNDMRESLEKKGSWHLTTGTQNILMKKEA